MANEEGDAAVKRPGDAGRSVVWAVLGVILLTPAVAMRFSDEVHWTGFDFLWAGAVLSSIGGGYELAVRMNGSVAYRAGALLALVTGVALVWVNAAVGFIGHSGNLANLMYVGVLAIALLGSILARFQARGVALALLGAALAQAGAGVAAVAMGYEVFLLAPTAVFTIAWLAAAGLFRMAAAP